MLRLLSAISCVALICLASSSGVRAQSPGKQSVLDRARDARLCREAGELYRPGVRPAYPGDLTGILTPDARAEAILKCFRTDSVKRIGSDYHIMRMLTERDFPSCPVAKRFLWDALLAAMRHLDVAPGAHDIGCKTTLGVYASLTGWRPDWAGCGGLYYPTGEAHDYPDRKRWLAHFSECLDLKNKVEHRELVRSVLQQDCRAPSDTSTQRLMAIYLPLVARAQPTLRYKEALRCDELLELAREAGVVDDAAHGTIAGKMDEGQKQAALDAAMEAKRAEEHQSARMEECRKSGAGDKAPEAFVVSSTVRDFFLNGCSNSQQLMLLFQGSGTRANPLALAATGFERRGSACTLSALGVQMSLAIESVSSLNCLRESKGRFRCAGFATFRCSTNAGQPAREALECAVWRNPLPIDFRIASNDACEWSITTP